MESKIFTYINTATLPLVDDGPMAGICVAVEPSISVENWPTDAQSSALENYVALEDATLILRLRNAGADLKGRTSMGELGLGLDRDTGGKAIKTGSSDVVLKTDTTGEARLSAAISGCFGFKPSYGLISRSGLIGLVPSMESCGILSNSLGKISKTAQAMAGLDEQDPSMDETGIEQALSRFRQSKALADNPMTLGVIREWKSAMGPEENKAFDQTMENLSAAGIKIKTVSIQDFCLAKTVHNVIGTVEASSSAGRFDSVRYGHRTSGSVKNWNEMYIQSRSESFGPLVKAYLFQGGYFQYQNYNAFLDACRIRARLMESVEKAFETVDLIALPVSGKPLPEKPNTVSGFYDAFSLTLLANLTGNPSISIPGQVNGDALEPALQLIGKRFDDAGLLAFAARVSDIYTGER